MSPVIPLRPPPSPPPPAPHHRLVPVREACAYARLGRTKLYDLIHRDKIVAKKRDGRTMIDLDSIDRFYSELPRVPPKPEDQSSSKDK